MNAAGGLTPGAFDAAVASAVQKDFRTKMRVLSQIMERAEAKMPLAERILREGASRRPSGFPRFEVLDESARREGLPVSAWARRVLLREARKSSGE